MSIRAHYEHNLSELQRQLLGLSETVEQAIVRALWGLLRHDTAAARRVVAEDGRVDELRYELEEQSLLLIARQQPSAGDLRQISAIIGVAGELERIGDYAKGIGKIVLRSAELRPIEPPAAVEEMARAAREMLRESLRAVVERDASAAERLEQMDDRVDQLYQTALHALLNTMRESPFEIEPATYLIWAAHNLERIADRTVNIGERAAFIAAGRPLYEV